MKSNFDNVNIVSAISLILGAVIFTGLFFFLPFSIAVKVHLFMIVSVIAAFLLGRYSIGSDKLVIDFSNLTAIELVSAIINGIALFWCGFVKFFQYWLDGGVEPFFHDIILLYIAYLAVLIVVWLLFIIIDYEKNVGKVVLVFKRWAYGYIAVYGLILFSLLLIEGD